MPPFDAAALVAEHGSISAAARASGLTRNAFRRRYRGQSAAPTFDIPIDEIRAQCRRRFEQAAAALAADMWRPIHLPDNKPTGILWFGDPHLDDDSCNWPLLERHVDLCASTPGLYGANIGDTTNNWVGRLMRLYADQETSRHTARRLAKWFLADSGVNWLLWILGNHDAWESGGDILQLMNGHSVLMRDWEAKVKFVFPSGEEIKCHAAHDFPGNSQWNIGHGPGKAARMASDGDLFVCGHKHDWTIQQFEIAGRHKVPTIIRARGYKFHDRHAIVNGFQSAQSGAGILTILNPGATDPAGRVLAFSDIEAGVAVLTALRAAPAGKRKAPARSGRRAKSGRRRAR